MNASRLRVPSVALALALSMAAIILTTPVRASRAAESLFVESAAQAGLNFTHVSGASGQYFMPEQMGAGVALFDYDGDGDLDVFLVQSGTLGKRDLAVTGRLFRNELSPAAGSALRFTDVTAKSGIDANAYGMGAATGDYDNDGDLDLLVTSFGPEALYRNNGNGTFTNVTQASGLGDDLWSSSAAFVDYDRDGDLDIFVANYLDFTVAGNKRCNDAVGARDYCSPRAYKPVPDRLYSNDGRGRFSDVSDAAGITKADGAGLGVSVGDYNGDGWLDLYVANDATPNQLWINQKNGTFVDDGLLSGTALNAAGNPEGSMGIASGDYDADGDEDLFVSNIVGETFVLYGNDGRASFDDIRARVGLGAPTAAFTGFGTGWFDYDNDGWLDLFVANGAVNVIEAQRGEKFPFRMRNQLFRNTGKGRFEEASKLGGPAFERAEIGRGAAFGDVDNDGDIDVVTTNNLGPVRLLINQSLTPGKATGGNHWLQLRVQQPQGNRLGFGAWVGVERAGQPTRWRRVGTDGSYLSASDSRVHVGLGAVATPVAVTVQWPDGVRERWTNVVADRLVTLQRGTGK